jgi:hypothetical protein
MFTYRIGTIKTVRFLLKQMKRESIFAATENIFLTDAPTKADRLTQTPPDPTIGVTMAACAFFATTAAIIRT